jgi:HSP20 family protein
MLANIRKKNYKPAYKTIFDGFFDYGNSAIQPVMGVESVLDGLLNDFDRSLFDYTRPSMSIINRFGGLESVPRANVSKNDRGYSIKLAAPGLSREDFDIGIDNSVLTVRTKTETEVESDGYKEFDYMNFERSWTLPKNAMLDRIEANYEAGILVLDIPYEDAVKEKSRKIEVK